MSKSTTATTTWSVPQVPGLLLRHAVPSDSPVVLDFIQALADYEHLSHEVVATREGLEAALYGEKKIIDVVIALLDGAPAGFALYFHSFSTFLTRPGIYLEDLFVHESLRGKGVGKALLSYLAKVAHDSGCGRLEWSVLDWNEPSIRFYQSLGAAAMDEWTVNRVTGAGLDNLADAVKFSPES
jgi:GNAT superfamily N-acetyltransferase